MKTILDYNVTDEEMAQLFEPWEEVTREDYLEQNFTDHQKYTHLSLLMGNRGEYKLSNEFAEKAGPPDVVDNCM